MTSSQKIFNQTVITSFHKNHGQVGGYLTYAPLLLITTTGKRSGQIHTIPLLYTLDDNRFIIIAANRGASTHPDWYYNLLAHRIVTVELGRDRFQARAEVLQEPERSRLYAQMASALPEFSEYQQRTHRAIPVIALKRVQE